MISFVRCSIFVVAAVLVIPSWQADTYCDNNCQPTSVLGFFCVPTNSSKYTQCANGYQYIQSCPAGTIWNPSAKYCDWPQNVGTACTCSQTASSTTTAAATTTTTKTTTTTTKAPSTTSTTKAASSTAAATTTTTKAASSTAGSVTTTTTKAATTSATTTKASTTSAATTKASTASATTTKAASTTSKVVMCYYTNWAQYRSGSAKFVPENINATLCTHIVYAFLNFDTVGMSVREWNDATMIPKVLNLKTVNANLKVLASIGGWNAGVGTFSNIIADSTTMNNWNRNALAFVRQYNFDGLDIDFEYPSSRGSPPADKARYAAWMQSLRTAINSETIPAGKSKLLLTIAIGAGFSTIDNGYDLPTISNAVDYINVMTYDFFGGTDGFTSFNAPLYAKSFWTATQKTQTTSAAIDYLITKGALTSKLVLGIPLYGRSYTLASASNFAVGAPTIGAGVQGKYTADPGFSSYYEACMQRKCSTTSYTFVTDSETQTPYLYAGTYWTSTEDTYSVAAKTQLALSKQLAGIMFWAIDLDDFNDMCQTGVKYPLIQSCVNVLKGGQPITVNFGTKSSTFC